MEALELGASCLLIDEDTSATNFMIRDARMQKLIAKEKEPITPFIDRVKDLKNDLLVSTVLVAGGSGEFFEMADTVIMMENYKAYLKTHEAKEITRTYPTERVVETKEGFSLPRDRSPRLDFLKQERKLKIKVFGKSNLSIGSADIDLSYVSQIVDTGQLLLIGDWLLHIFRNESLKNKPLREICVLLEKKGLTTPLSDDLSIPHGDGVYVRRFEIAAAINRLRSISFSY
jgi:predicted ABC-class ATPase